MKSRSKSSTTSGAPRRWKGWQVASAAVLVFLLGWGAGGPDADQVVEAAQPARGRRDPARKPPARPTWTVVEVIDGDTIDVANSDGSAERVRLIGIDTPERGECGFGPSTSALQKRVLDREVQLVDGAQDNRDMYDRLLRYVSVDGADAGLALIRKGLAIARYDSRDGYGRHPREDKYIAADEASRNLGCATSPAQRKSVPLADLPPEQDANVYYENCDAARAGGAAPVRRGDPGYGSHLDRDGDGVGCE